jgi:hypothetical protein
MAWLNIQTRNRSAVARITPLYARRPARHLRTECRGATERFESFEVLTDCWVLFELEDEPPALEAQLFKDVLHRGGGYKIFRYYDDEPRASRAEAD